MLTEYSVANFKAFGAPQAITLKPITLVFGANSSGKSSLIHSLLLADEGLASGDFSPTFTRLGGDSVDLGSFTNFIHKHDPSQELTLMFTSNLEC
jgi:AAA15 family ATPase/GTPase